MQLQIRREGWLHSALHDDGMSHTLLLFGLVAASIKNCFDTGVISLVGLCSSLPSFD